jgi:site-specific recombinase XerD
MTLLVSINNLKVVNMNITAKNILMETIVRIDCAYAPATIRAYKSNFERFIEYCDQEKIMALPADQETVARYIRDISNGKLKSASIRIAVASISAIHRLNEYSDPTSLPNVRIELRKMHRKLGRGSKQAMGINLETLDKMLKYTDRSLIRLRDRALLLTAYDGLCRRSEVVDFRVEDISQGRDDLIKIKLRRSKTDQDGVGRWINLKIETQLAIIDWLNISGIKTGKLFRGINKGNHLSDGLDASQINRIYKKLASRCEMKYEIIKKISGHSLRVGAAQDLLLSGASIPLIMTKGRWSKADTMMRYIENAEII